MSWNSAMAVEVLESQGNAELLSGCTKVGPRVILNWNAAKKAGLVGTICPLAREKYLFLSSSSRSALYPIGVGSHSLSQYFQRHEVFDVDSNAALAVRGANLPRQRFPGGSLRLPERLSALRPKASDQLPYATRREPRRTIKYGAWIGGHLAQGIESPEAIGNRHAVSGPLVELAARCRHRGIVDHGESSAAWDRVTKRAVTQYRGLTTGIAHRRIGIGEGNPDRFSVYRPQALGSRTQKVIAVHDHGHSQALRLSLCDRLVHRFCAVEHADAVVAV